MATLTYGSIVTNIRGSIGGHTFQKCGTQFSIKNKSVHNPPSSDIAVISRMQFNRLASLWSNMSVADRQTFYDYASTYPTFDKYGQIQTLSGYSLFQYINRKLVIWGGSPVTSIGPYVNPPHTSPSISSMDLSAQTCTITLGTALAADHVLLLYVGRVFPLNAYVSDWRLKFCYAYGVGTSFPYNAYNDIVSVNLFTPSPSSKFFWRMFVVNSLTGASTIDWEMFSTIVP